MYDMNRLGELEKKFFRFWRGFEVITSMFVSVFLLKGIKLLALWCIQNLHSRVCADVPLPSSDPISEEISHIIIGQQPCPLRLAASDSLPLPPPPASTILWIPSIVQSALAWGPRRRSRAIDPWRWQFTRGQHCQGSEVKAEWVKWDWMCPPCCQEPWRSARPSSFCDPGWSIVPHLHL